MELTLQTFQTEFDTFISVIQNLLADKAYGKHNRLLYNVDFALLFPYLWGSSPPSVPPFKPYGRRIFETLAEASTLHPDFQLVFTGPSFWELLDSIYHQVKHFERMEYSAQSQYESLREKADPNDWKSTLIKSGMAAEELEIMCKDGYTESVRAPIQRATDLISTQALLKGLGDFISEQKEIRALYAEAFKEVWQRMSHDRSPSDTRSAADAAFHYKVDSANIVASAAINANNKDVKLLFTTEANLRNRYCREDGRNPLVPVYWVGGMLLRRGGYIDSEESFFRSMLDKANEIKTVLSRVADIDALNGFSRKEIIEFYSKYVLPLRNAKQGGDLRGATVQDDDAFREMVTDQKKFERRFAEAKEDLILSGKQLAELEPALLEDGLTEVMDAGNDEVVRRIRRKFKLR